jgi:hypothetical protein
MYPLVLRMQATGKPGVPAAWQPGWESEIHADVGKRIARVCLRGSFRQTALSTNYKVRGGASDRHAGGFEKEWDTLDREHCPSFSASSGSQPKVFRLKCLIERILFVIGFF